MAAQRETYIRYNKKSALWMTAAVILLLFMSAFVEFELPTSLENKTIDMRFQFRGQRKPEAPVCIAAIDEKSLQEVGRWPWSRSVQADLVQTLKRYGVKYVFYDVWFSEPEVSQDKQTLGQLEQVLGARRNAAAGVEQMRTRLLAEIRKLRGREDGDSKFARVLKEAGNVFLPIVPLNNNEGRSPNEESLHCTPVELLGTGEDIPFKAKTLILSIPKIQTRALDSGHIRYGSDSDGIYRYFFTVIPYGNVWIPQIAVQMARYHLGASREPARLVPGEYLLVGDKKVPVIPEGAALIDYCGDKATIPTYSIADILAERLAPEKLKGQVVMVGPTADGLSDIRATPMEKNLPGVEVNANIFENIVGGRHLTLAAGHWRYLLILLLALVMWTLVPRLTPYQGMAAFLALLAGLWAAAQAAFSPGRTVIPLVYPLLSLLLTYLLLTTYKLMTEVRHSRYMKQMFQSMVAPSVVEEILKMPTGIELGGEEKVMTVMFSDIRGFTTYSEKHSAHEVVEILNEYLTQMTHMIFQTEGTLDKYIGDAIMAFWGSPAPQNDHGYRACSTALGMVELLHKTLHPKWELEGKEKLQIGIGLSTGPMVVGFVGSEHIKNYTLIGDTVNLGSRLEGTTKEYQAEIIMSEATYALVKDDMLCRELDLILVKGMRRPLRIYELLDRLPRASGERKALAAAFGEGLAEYRARRFEEAARKFKICLGIDPLDGPSKVFLERCDVLKKAPPPADWDGVFVMKTK